MRPIVNTLISGATGSGKSELMFRLIEQDPRPLLVHDLAADTRYVDAGASLHTMSDEEYLSWYWSNQNCLCVVDEAWEAIGQWNRPLAATATRGRHQGHRNYFLSLFAIGFSTAVRGQCSEVYCFRLSQKDADDMAGLFGCPWFSKCPLLGEFEFYHLIQWSEDGRAWLTRGRADREGIHEEEVSEFNASVRTAEVQ